MRHKHADLIHAWAENGGQVQYLSAHGWADVKNPTWLDEYAYRIKPKPKPDVVRYVNAHVDRLNYLATISQYHQDNLKLTFDGETGKLKHAEVL